MQKGITAEYIATLQHNDQMEDQNEAIAEVRNIHPLYIFLLI